MERQEGENCSTEESVDLDSKSSAEVVVGVIQVSVRIKRPM
jgi:hypothetical protein